MKSLLVILFTFITITVSAQTKTILAIPQDTTNKVDLKLNEINRLNTSSHLLFAAGVISTMVIYNLNNKPLMAFAVPLGFCLSGMGTHIYMSHLEKNLIRD